MTGNLRIELGVTLIQWGYMVVTAVLYGGLAGSKGLEVSSEGWDIIHPDRFDLIEYISVALRCSPACK